MNRNKLIAKPEDKPKRKGKESQKNQALFPPGLYNHHNTCFFNSTLQAIIATSLIENVITFQPSPTFRYPIPPTPIAPNRSPALTNGRGGVFEKKWVNRMPLCDAFIAFNQQAYRARNSTTNDALSPRHLLNCLGAKYGQYLDFRQQDAHELLRQLLDGMQMEEMDEIKRRETPRPTPTRGLSKSSNPPRTANNSSTDTSSEHMLPPISEEEKLHPFVSMLFGGKLASILVCEGCKHVSHTYEDFMDLSLSLKADEKDRKRHRLKQFAQKFRKSPQTTTQPPPPPIVVPTGSIKAPKPMPAGSPPLNSHALPPFLFNDVPRASSVPPPTPFSAEPNPFDDLRRRSAEYPSGDRGSASFSQPSDPSVLSINPGSPSSSITLEMRLSSPHPTENMASMATSLTDLGVKISRKVSTKLGMKTKDRSRSRSRAANNDESTSSSIPEVSLHSDSEMSSGLLHGITDHLSAPNLPLIRPVSPTQPSTSRPKTTHSKSRQKSRAERAAREQAYLRAVLRDEPSIQGNAQALWKMAAAAALGQSGLEDCLRQFTAVEALDGENSFACKRCWRKANPTLAALQKAKRSSRNPDNSESSEEDTTTDPSSDEEHVDRSRRGTADPAIIPLPASRPLTPQTPHFHDPQTSHLSVSDAMLGATTSHPRFGGVPIPAISTTPDSPIADATKTHLHQKHLVSPNSGLYLSPSHSIDSVGGSSRKGVRKGPRSPSDASSTASSDESEKDAESGTSFTTSSEADIHPNSSAPVLKGLISQKEPKEVLPPKSQRVIHRRALKRYLISAPPPVLVIHLKRFQQINKSNMMFGNFKKLDDYVAFPEFLDLKSFIAPRREDFGLKGNESRDCNLDRGRNQLQAKHEWWRLGHDGETLEEPKVLYRLHAVVVHIGSMLGGHYIAYAALSHKTSLEASNPDPSYSTKVESTSEGPKAVSQDDERKWCFVSDTTVRLATIEEVLKAKAYLCFYERMM